MNQVLTSKILINSAIFEKKKKMLLARQAEGFAQDAANFMSLL